MSLESAPLGAAPALTPAVWLWPVAAAALAAWPVWRSMFAEVPDLGEGWLRLQPMLGLANAALYLFWTISRRRSVHQLFSPLWVIIVGVGLVLIGTKRGDSVGADLGALIIGWTAISGIFATLVLLQTQVSGIRDGCRPPHHAELLPPILWLGAGVSVVMLAITLLIAVTRAWGLALALAGVMSPGLILAWSSLSDTARAVLSKRQVYFSDAEFLQMLSRRRHWLLRAPTIVVTDRVKLVSLYPAADIKPGELVGLAAAAALGEESAIGRAIQEFGVTHRIRLPALRRPKPDEPPAPRQARLANGATIELRDADDSLDLSAYQEAVTLARSQHRTVMVVAELAPEPRVLGVIVFAIGVRAGTIEALRALRDRGHEVVLAAVPRDAADEAALKSLNITRAAAEPSADARTVSVWRRNQAITEIGEDFAIGFGAVGAAAGASAPHIIVAREDARALADLARFAEDFRRRTWIVTLLASAPGWVLIAAVMGYAPVTPFLVTGVAVIGIAAAAAAPQVLRLSPALDMEGAED